MRISLTWSRFNSLYLSYLPSTRDSQNDPRVASCVLGSYAEQSQVRQLARKRVISAGVKGVYWGISLNIHLAFILWLQKKAEHLCLILKA